MEIFTVYFDSEQTYLDIKSTNRNIVKIHGELITVKLKSGDHREHREPTHAFLCLSWLEGC